MPYAKQTRLNMLQKFVILKKLDDGVRANRLAIDFGVSEAAISLIKKQKLRIFEAVAKNQEATRKTLHKAEYEALEERLYKWILEQWKQNRSVNGSILRAKARKMFTKVYPDRNADDFMASDGWFTKFKRRHGMRFFRNFDKISTRIHQITLTGNTSAGFIEPLQPKIVDMNQDEVCDHLQDHDIRASCMETH